MIFFILTTISFEESPGVNQYDIESSFDKWSPLHKTSRSLKQFTEQRYPLNVD